MANTVHVVYQLDDDKTKEISEAGGRLPVVREIHPSALEDHIRKGFVRVNRDGTPYVEAEPAAKVEGEKSTPAVTGAVAAPKGGN